MVTKRMRKRYLALRVESDQHFNERDLMDAVWNAVLQLFGEYGASQTNLRLIKYDLERNYMVVRCSHLALENVRASIASITEIQGKPAVIHVMGVSGTLKGLRKKALI
jgi:ribonuclease P/MRP protein subunit POP5